ncbi:MAG: hypothetical protein R3D05_08365 [Dongiaceae bacterium]
MAGKKIIVSADKVLGSKAGVVVGANPKADRETTAKVLVKVTAPASKG